MITNPVLSPITTTTTTTPNVPTPSLSSFSFSNLSPEVAQILAQAKGNATSAAANHLPTTVTATTIPTNTLFNGSTTITSVTPTITNPSVTSTPNLPAPPHLLSALLNMTRPPGHETQNGKNQIIRESPKNFLHVCFSVPPTNPIANLLPNLPLNFNLPPPPTPFPLLIASALSLGIPPPPTASKPKKYFSISFT